MIKQIRRLKIVLINKNDEVIKRYPKSKAMRHDPYEPALRDVEIEIFKENRKNSEIQI